MTPHHNGLYPSPLKINKDSHFIKKTTPPPPHNVQQHRQPLIIYTHSPKVIHTNPRDFMSLVQKLTGVTRSNIDGDDKNDNDYGNDKRRQNLKSEISQNESVNNGNFNVEKKKDAAKGNFGAEDSESSSVITCEESLGDGQVNSCFLPPYFDKPGPYMPVFKPNRSDFLSSPMFPYTDSVYYAPPFSMRSSSSTFEAMDDFRDY